MPQRHGVLGEMGVGVLVDVVGLVVAPVLEELHRGPRVIDLVEVHVVRLGQPVPAQRDRRQQDAQRHEQVEPVETSGGLADEGRAPVARAAAGW